MTTEEFPVKNIPEMFCFAGNNTSIETSKIKVNNVIKDMENCLIVLLIQYLI